MEIQIFQVSIEYQKTWEAWADVPSKWHWLRGSSGSSWGGAWGSALPQASELLVLEKVTW